MKTVLNDLESHNLTLTEAVNTANGGIAIFIQQIIIIIIIIIIINGHFNAKLTFFKLAQIMP